MLIDNFIKLGTNLFSSSAWHRVPFQPILYFFLWAATIRIVVVDDVIPIPFKEELGESAETTWNILSLICPPLSLLSFWLMFRSLLPRAALAGLWVRLAADVGQFVSLLTFHIANALATGWGDESAIYSRYINGAVLAFVLLLVVRDVWALLITDRLARAISGRDQ